MINLDQKQKKARIKNEVLFDSLSALAKEITRNVYNSMMNSIKL